MKLLKFAAYMYLEFELELFKKKYKFVILRIGTTIRGIKIELCTRIKV